MEHTHLITEIFSQIYLHQNCSDNFTFLFEVTLIHDEFKYDKDEYDCENMIVKLCFSSNWKCRKTDSLIASQIPGEDLGTALLNDSATRSTLLLIKILILIL